MWPPVSHRASSTTHDLHPPPGQNVSTCFASADLEARTCELADTAGRVLRRINPVLWRRAVKSSDAMPLMETKLRGTPPQG